MRHSRYAATAVLLCLATPAMADTIHVQDPIPFSESAYIADNIKAECRMGAQLATSLGSNAPKFGNTIAFDALPTTRLYPFLAPGLDGRVLYAGFENSGRPCPSKKKYIGKTLA